MNKFIYTYYRLKLKLTTLGKQSQSRAKLSPGPAQKLSPGPAQNWVPAPWSSKFKFKICNTICKFAVCEKLVPRTLTLSETTFVQKDFYFCLLQ